MKMNTGNHSCAGSSKRRRFASWLVLLAAFVAAAVSVRALADEAPQTRPCTGADLSGTYMLADFQEHPRDGRLTSQISTSPYLFLAFFPGAAWSEMGFNNPPATPEFLMRSLTPQLPGRKYTLEPDGRIVLSHGAVAEFVGRCGVSLNAGKGFQANDLVLSGNITGNPSEVHELFRPWTGGPVVAAVLGFDPVPMPAQEPATAALPDVQPSLPDKPQPVNTTLRYNASGEDVSILVTNQGHAPLSAFMLVSRSRETGGKLKDTYVDACLDHRQAWQPGQYWTSYVGLRLAVEPIHVQIGAALFSDGSTWGDPHRLAKLIQHRGNCKWPGS